MIRINQANTTAFAAVLVPLASKLPFLLDVRQVAISKMSGHPEQLHALGRLQRMISLPSYENLLRSLIKLSDIAFLTAEIIESMDAVNLNKYQVNRTEIVTYVANIAASRRSTPPTEDDIDLIAHLITSAEANPNAWTLRDTSSSDNLHLKILALYREVADPTTKTALATYAPDKGEIVPYHSLSMFSRGRTDKEKDETKPDQDPRISNGAVIHQFAAMRVVDHVYQLLMSREVWYHFLAPRKVADVASNLDRANSLRVFSLYLQSLLTYHQFFGLEAFLSTYDVVQKWVADFPSLETETTNKIEATIRKHDYLDAKGDVQRLFASFSKDATAKLNSVVYPQEYMDTFGFRNELEKIEREVTALVIPAGLDNLQDFDKPEFLPLTSGLAADKFDIVYDLADMLIREKIVASVVDEALKGLIPSMTRGISKASLTALNALAIKCTIPFEIPHATTFQTLAGVRKGIRGGQLELDSASPDYALNYHKLYTTALKFRMFIDRSVPSIYEDFSIPYVVDYDKAAYMRDLMETQWKCLIPSHMAPGEMHTTYALIMADFASVREFIQRLVGTDHEIFIRQLGVAHMRQTFATFLSGCGILYYVPGDNRDLETSFKEYDPNVDNPRVKMVPGYGKPFGTTYPALAAAQGNIAKDEKLIPIGRGLYIRLLKFMPTPTKELKFDSSSFYNQYPVSYFASNSDKKAVSSWVLGDGLWNFNLCPVSVNRSVPAIRFTPRFAYATAGLYLNLHYAFRPATADPAREVAALNLVEESWPFDRQFFWTRYVHWGPYVQPAAPELAKEEEVRLTDLIEKVEEKTKSEAKQEKTDSENAGKATENVVAKANEEVKKEEETRRKGGPGEDDAKVVV